VRSLYRYCRDPIEFEEVAEVVDQEWKLPCRCWGVMLEDNVEIISSGTSTLANV
jgi:hypothetical protein